MGPTIRRSTSTSTPAPVKNNVVFGGDFDHERISINSYTGLTSEGLASEGLVSSTGAPITSIYDPTNYLSGLGTPTLGGNPQIYNVDTKAVYLLETANYNDWLIFNAGVRYDNYQVTSSNNTSSAQNTSNIPTYNVGLVYKPIPITSIYAAYATAADPVGDELDATASSYGGPRAKPAGVANLWAATEPGRRSRQQMGIVRSPASGFRRAVSNQCRKRA